MSTPYIGQLMLCSWRYAAKGWAMCNGQILPINQNQALFSLLGTYFGGNGASNFALPNLQGQTPIGIGNGFSIGMAGGEVSHTLSAAEVPLHTHVLNATSATAGTDTPKNSLFAAGGVAVYQPASNLAAMNSSLLTTFGGSQPHQNMQPYLVMNWCIALNGIFPSQS